MISSTFGAPFGGTTVGGHQGFEFLASRLMVPPNAGGAAGSDWPSIVDVALGEPSVPVTCWAAAGKTEKQLAASTARKARVFIVQCSRLAPSPIVVSEPNFARVKDVGNAAISSNT